MIIKKLFTNDFYGFIFGFVIQYVLIFIIIEKNFNKIYRIIKVINISGYVFFIIFSWQILIKEINYIESIISNISYNKKKINKSVVWIIFDEFDPQIAFDKKYKIYLENFEILKETSFFAKEVNPPAKDTIDSIPAQLLCVHTSGNIVDGFGNLFLVNKKNKKKIKFIYKNTLFNKLNNYKFTVAIHSSVLNYCKYFGSYKCHYYWAKNRISLNNLKDYILIFINFINPLEKFFSLKYHYKNKTSSIFLEKEDNSRLIENLKTVDFHFNKNISINNSDIINLIDIDKIIQEINGHTNLIFVHIYLPHLPSYYSEKIFNINPSNQLESYILNLKLSDLILKSIFEKITLIKNKEIMLITSSDHWLRAKNKNETNYYPALLIAKIMNDNTKIEFIDKTNLIYLGDLIQKYLKNEISHHKDIEKFFFNHIDETPPFIKPKIKKNKNE
jgi:hypothetical protein